MKISAGTVVSFHYCLLNGDQELESSFDGDPMAFLYGKKNIIAGLEEAMLDKAAGDTFTVTLAPEKAYGLRRDDALQRVPIKHLHNAQKIKNKLKPGMVVHINTDQGSKQSTVVKVGRFNVDVDTNHPLAGLALTFEVNIIDVRQASDDEIAHGHAHGVGGHHH
jgi:FKBP-type peptidyl-prolyl cis-trans isomerase SlyD